MGPLRSERPRAWAGTVVGDPQGPGLRAVAGEAGAPRSLGPCAAFQGMKVFFMVVAAVYVLYLLFLVVRACSELRHMPYVGERLFLRAQGQGAGGHRASGRRGDPETAPPWSLGAGDPTATLGHAAGASASAGEACGRKPAGPGVAGLWALLDPSSRHRAVSWSSSQEVTDPESIPSLSPPSTWPWPGRDLPSRPAFLRLGTSRPRVGGERALSGFALFPCETDAEGAFRGSWERSSLFQTSG